MWIFGLAEALAVVLIAAIVFGVKWLRLRRERKRASARIAALIAAEIAETKTGRGCRAALRDAHLAFLTALSLPFRKDRVGDEDVWEWVLDTFARNVQQLEQITDDRSATGRKPLSGGADPREIRRARFDHAHPPAEPIPDLEIESLLAGLRNRLFERDADGKAAEGIKIKYAQLERAHEDLKARLESNAKLDPTGELREELDEARRYSLEFMQTAARSKRNFNILSQEHEVLEEHVEQLSWVLEHNRHSAHHLLVERDSLAEENKQLTVRLEMKDRHIEQLNRNYTILRREYNQLYGVTQ
ncbi:hypothetical protein CKO23_12990 [Thiocystis violacea]|nr:hypothetical protein [Thiocystis violacea]